MTVADRIKARREELGLTQEDLALKMGYKGKGSVCKIESSGNRLTLKTVEKYALALNCTESYLMGWEDEPDLLSESIDAISNLIMGTDTKLERLVIAYSKMSPKQQDALLNMAESMI